MTNASETRAPLGTLRALLSILLAIAVLVAAQTLALLLGEVLLGAGVPGPACNVLTAVLYVLFALGGAALLCRFVLHLPLAALRIGRLRIRPVWALAAFALPALVLAGAILAGGRWEVHRFDAQTVWLTVTGGVFYYGLAAGIVEEVIFRGVILGWSGAGTGRSPCSSPPRSSAWCTGSARPWTCPAPCSSSWRGRSWASSFP